MLHSEENILPSLPSGSNTNRKMNFLNSDHEPRLGTINPKNPKQIDPNFSELLSSPNLNMTNSLPNFAKEENQIFKNNFSIGNMSFNQNEESKHEEEIQKEESDELKNKNGVINNINKKNNLI